MASPANEYAYDLDLMVEAADRYDARAVARDAKRRHLDAHEYDKADTRPRLTKQINRLLSKVRQSMPAAEEVMPAALVELVERGPITEAEYDNDMYERVINETRDFLAIEFLEKGLQVNRCVGRVVRSLGRGRVSYGTGFLVAPRLMMTNWHVLREAGWAAKARLELDYQRNRSGVALTPQSFALVPHAFFLSDRAHDFAVVAVEPESTGGAALADYGWCPLIKDEGKIAIGNCVNVIQHPKGEMKQIVIRENELCDLPQPEEGGDYDRFAYYEADTERGSSGSPVFNDQWEVIALHHAGVPRRNGKQLLNRAGGPWNKGDDPDDVDWVANEGVRISRIVRAIADASVNAHERKLRALVLAAEPPPDMFPTGPVTPRPELKRTVRPEPVNEEDVRMDQNNPTTGARLVRLTIPITITVSVDAPLLGGAAAAEARQSGSDAAAADADAREGLDEHYGDRPGFQSDFLGVEVPLPRLTKAMRPSALVVDESVADGEPARYELKYHHYSVIMNAKRRLAIVSAVNYDPRAKFRVERESGDKWYRDPRVDEIAPTLQADNRYYQGRDNPLDRGHLTRRADAAWGKTLEEAETANTDTFHWTNCAPQHEVYNQSGKATKAKLLLWGNIENHIASEAGRNKRPVNVFNGPVFAGKDPWVPAAKKPADRLQVPRAFWKIVVMERDNGNLGAYGFLLGQEAQIDYLADEDFDEGDFHVYQVKVKELEARTKLDFGDLRTFDLLEDPAREESFEDGTEAVLIEGLGDIVT